MKSRPVLLFSALSLLFAGPAVGTASIASAAPAIVVAQQGEECPPRSECAAQKRKENRAKRAGEGQDNRDGKGQKGKAKQQGQKDKGQQGKKQGGGEAKPPKRKDGGAERRKAEPPKQEGRAKPAENAAEPAQRARERREQRQELRQERGEKRQENRQERREDRKDARQDRQENKRERQETKQERQETKQERPQELKQRQNNGQERDAAPARRAEQPARDADRPRRQEPDRADGQQPAQGAGERTREERRRDRAERRQRQRQDAPARVGREQDADATTVERQLAAQGRGEEAGRVRELRRKLRQQRQAAQARRVERREDAQERREDAGDRRERRRDREVVERRGDRVIFRAGVNLFIEPEQADDRLLWRARDVEVEEFGAGFTRTIVYRENGVRIVTVRDPYGYIVSRTRYLPDGGEIILIDQPYLEYAPEPVYYEEIVLPPLVVSLPQPEYIVETRVATPVQIETALTAPPVEPVERAYTLEEVRRSERLRDKMRRVDIDTITFEFGSAVISQDQLDALDRVGEAIEETLRNDPDEVFLIEGHTDAVGSQEDNLVLSDRRAEAVAVALSEDFDIPPENLVTQGYGEDQLKVATQEAARENRRVSMRRITPLLQGVAARQ